MKPVASYLRQHPALEEVVATCQPTRNHSALLDHLRREPALAAARLATTRGDTWLHRRKVFGADGTLVADDHEAWLAEQVARDGGNVRATCARLDNAGYRLSQCKITTLYVVAAGHSGTPSDFLQIEVDLEEEVLDRELRPGGAWRMPRTLDELQREADQGLELPLAQRLPVRPRAYRLRRIVDVEAWLQVADAMEDARREAICGRRYRVTSSETPGATIQTPDELFPGWDRFPAKHRRFFRDWRRSSAAPHRLCDQWVLKLTDWTDPRDGRRSLDMVPMWVFSRPLAKVNAAKGSDYEFYGTLEKLDRRTGVTFGWFFYMLHGNRVEADAGRRVIRAAEAGTIVMPECDYRVLKDWEAEPYGF
ncbi:hypothetical protein R2APBS1_2022 [Rhodanobacter denitrificans]|uniref:Uncharacterized protein n=1 Tax=Rhodanobacter denitrificans TaxID=666685 RepID=M4NEB7_9GAMM|nr:hypothetical protein [Rhodanobacter denitrificans]AGG89145.1 hypothetical protein R2APBS1_2022 [Rhodanobacter denitrificans]